MLMCIAVMGSNPDRAATEFNKNLQSQYLTKQFELGCYHWKLLLHSINGCHNRLHSFVHLVTLAVKMAASYSRHLYTDRQTN